MTIDRELKEFAKKWKISTDNLNDDLTHNRRIASHIVGAFGTMSKELSEVIENNPQYIQAQEILELAADLEWQNYTAKEQQERWDRLRGLVNALIV